MSTCFDAIVIGGGPGGYTCAARLGEYGLRTALVEKAELGGTCLNRGCIPTKTLLHTAELLQEVRRGALFGLMAGEPSVDYEALRARKQSVVETLRGGVAHTVSAAGVTVYAGTGYVPAAGKVCVTAADGTAEELEAPHIVVATGSVPARLPIPGMDLPGVLTSDDLLREVPQLDSLIIIGGGVIGMEFASLYAALGTKVTVVEGLARILPTMDRELSQTLALSMKKRGAELITGARVNELARDGEELVCRYTVKDKPGEARGAAVLVAVGRRVALDAVLAPEVLPACERGRAVVDAQLRSSIPGIWVIGDAAAGYPQLAHAAAAQALTAAAAIAGKPCDIDLNLTPGCVYTTPEIASVGLTEAEAKEQGYALRCGKALTTANGKSVLTEQERGFIKIVAEKGGRILGAQLCCARATDLVGELALAIAQGLTPEQAAAVTRAHPTFEECIGEALEACCRKG